MQLVKKLAISGSIIALGLEFFGAVGRAQTPPTVHHPGDTVTITVLFDGTDAHRLQNVTVNMGISDLPKDQAGFSNTLYFGESKPDGPGVFKLSLKISNNTASGVYKLTQIRARASIGEAPTEITYNEGLPTYSITVENDKRFARPAIKSVREP